MQIVAAVLLAAQCVSAAKTPPSALAAALALTPPSATAKIGGEFEGSEFWRDNAELLAQAWTEYGPLHADLYDPSVLPRYLAGGDLATGSELAPGIFNLSSLFLRPFTEHLRDELHHLGRSGIPMRRPNGMNRYGVILEDVGLGPTIEALVRDYLVPLALRTFPGSARRDDLSEFFAFAVRYREGEDVNLAPHTDASVVTANLCLGESGGELSFDAWSQWPASEVPGAPKSKLRLEAGSAILHRGQHRHEALPLESGERVNLIIWLFGDQGDVRIAEYPEDERHSREELQQGAEAECTAAAATGAPRGVLNPV